MGKIGDRKILENRFMRRRQFLVGVGGALLALPPLMSVMSKTAAAGTPGRVRRLVCFPTLYGISPSMFFPPTPPASMQTQQASPDLPIWTTPLTGQGSPFNLPYTSDASGIGMLGTAFQSVLSQVNLYQGLDFAVADSATTGHTYGPLGANCISSGSSLSNSAGGRSVGYGQSIDNVIAKSSNFYTKTPAVPVLRMASTVDGVNFSYSRTSRNTSPADPTYEDFYLGDAAAFNQLFSNVPTSSTPSSASSASANQIAIADTFLQDYKTLKNNPRLSSADQQILDQYVSGIGDLQARIRANQAAAAACSSSNIAALKGQIQTRVDNKVYWGFPGEDTSGDTTGITSCLQLLKNFNAIIQNAFLCDLTRVVTVANEIYQDAVLSGYTIGNEFHCHNATVDGPMHAWFLNNVVASLAALLQSTPDPLNPGTSLLDNTVILFTNEHSGGDAQHSGRSLPIMTIGSAGGALKTGYYIDCRQRPYTGDQYSYDLGRPYAQLLISIMQAVGLQSDEYLSVGGNGNPNGFGDFDGTSTSTYLPFASTHNSPLPFVNV